MYFCPLSVHRALKLCVARVADHFPVLYQYLWIELPVYIELTVTAVSADCWEIAGPIIVTFEVAFAHCACNVMECM